MKSRFKRSLSFLAFLLFVGTGTYNAVVINSESTIKGSDIRYVKRLDESWGVVEPGRLVAANVSWQKLSQRQEVVRQHKRQLVEQEVRTVSAAPATEAQPPVTAAVQEELSLNLAEVVNPTKWKDGLKDGFSGSLTTSNGAIESLEVSLPGEEGVSVSFSEMSGNVFSYDLNGEVYSGMLYQVDQHAYMVNLTNGPLEGTRLKFVARQEDIEQEQPSAIAGENSQAVATEYGNNSESLESQYAQEEKDRLAYEQQGAQPQETQQAQAEQYQPQFPEGFDQAAYQQAYQQAMDQDALMQQQAMQANGQFPEQPI